MIRVTHIKVGAPQACSDFYTEIYALCGTTM